MRMGAQRQVRESRVSLGARQSHHWEVNPPTPPPLIPDPSPLFPGAGRVGSSESGPSPARTARRSQQAALSPQRLPWEEAPSSKPSLLVQPRGPPARHSRIPADHRRQHGSLRTGDPHFCALPPELLGTP